MGLSDRILSLNVLTEIHRCAGINRHGKTIYRSAVRGVILHGRNLLMVYSAAVGDYKFPGGGVDEHETHAQALTREIREECGASLIHIGCEMGAVIEYNFPIESGYDVFKMTSHYYQCDVEETLGAQNLDGYEQQLGFRPVWIDIEHAIQINKSLLNSDKRPEWLRREIFVLEYIQRNLLNETDLSLY